MTLDEVFATAQKIGGLGFGTLLVLILWGSYRGIWVWGRQLTKAEGEAEQWKAMALQATGLAERLTKKP